MSKLTGRIEKLEKKRPVTDGEKAPDGIQRFLESFDSLAATPPEWWDSTKKSSWTDEDSNKLFEALEEAGRRREERLRGNSISTRWRPSCVSDEPRH